MAPEAAMFLGKPAQMDGAVDGFPNPFWQRPKV